MVHVAAVVASVFLTGCGAGDRPPLGEVKGKVTLDGQPLQEVIVTFTPEVGRPAAGLTDANGMYELSYTHDAKGTKVGPNSVSFEWPTGAVGRPIPRKYADGSALQVDVESGDNTFDFELSSKG